MDTNLLKPLSPRRYETWCLRSRRPTPGLRVFGRFALPNVFVGTHVVKRKKLGGFGAMNWEIERLNCEEHWNALFQASPLSGGDSLTHYVTENADDGEWLPDE